MSVHGADVSTSATELERLRAEVARLEADLHEREHYDERPPAGPPERTGRRPSRWRWLVAGVLLVLVPRLAPLAVVAPWVPDQIPDTDRYVQPVTPLASDPAIQDAAIARVTNAIYTRLDVEAVTKEAVDALAAQGLPPRVATSLSALSTPLANGVRSFIERAVARLVRSDQFQQAWVAANREAHTQMGA